MAQNTPQTRVTVDKTPLPKVRADLLVLGIYKDTKKLPPALTAVDKAAGQAVSNLLKTGDFTGKADETALLYPLGKFGCRRIMLVGLGDKVNLCSLVIWESPLTGSGYRTSSGAGDG